MEFIVCMLLASILAGGRIGVDLASTLKGNPAPHVEKARIRAEEERERLAAKTARREARNRPRPADGKPRTRDVIAVYWGDAMADAIDVHNRRRERKKNPQPADAKKPGLFKQAWAAIVNPVGPASAEADQPTAEAVPPGTQAGPRIACEDCGQPLTKKDGRWLHPSSSGCPARVPAPATAAATDRPSRAAATGKPGLDWPANGRCGKCGQVGPLTSVGWCEPCGLAGEHAFCAGCRGLMYRDGDVFRHGASQGCNAVAPAGNRVPGPSAPARQAAGSPSPDTVQRASARAAEEYRAAATGPIEQTGPATSSEGAPMTDVQTAPTGEAANYETAIAELDKLEAAQQAHLDQAIAARNDIQHAKQRISDTQATYRPAADAAGMVHESLTALNLDQETVANTGQMADAMPPNEVDAMFAQLEEMEARAQQQVANAEAALAATAAARQVIVSKYGDAHATVQGELGGDARFLSGDGVASGGDRSGFTAPPVRSELEDAAWAAERGDAANRHRRQGADA